MIDKVQFVKKADHFEGKILFSPRNKSLDIREVRTALREFIEEVLEELDGAQGGGFRGYWRNGRLQEIVIEKAKRQRAKRQRAQVGEKK